MELTQWKEKLDVWFNDKEPEMLTLLERIVNMDSSSHDGDDVNKVGETLAAWMAEVGFQTARLPKRPSPPDEPWMDSLGNVFCARSHAEEAGPGVAFIGHMDTVFPAGTAAARPFRLDRAADRATGPGAADMKAGLVQNMFVARALKELGLMPVPMTLTFTPDEELGSASSASILGEQLNGAHAVLCSEAGYPGNGVTIERKGSGHMLLEITGKAAHAGRNYEEGASAILELAHNILAFNEHLDLTNGTTVNTGLISGGISANSVAPNAWARLHLSFARLEDGLALADRVREETACCKVPGTHAHVSGGVRLPPLETTPTVRQLYELAAHAGECLDYYIHAEHSKGAAESGYCSSVLGLPVLCSMGPEGADMHSPAEYFRPSTLIPRCKLMALTALQAAHVFTAAPKARL